MIDLNKLKENPKLAERLVAKGSTADIDHLLSLNNSKNVMQVELDDLKNKKNEISKLIGELAKKSENIDEHKNKSNKINDSIHALQEKFNLAKKEITDLLLSIPNIPDDDVPTGSNEDANIVISENIYKQKSEGLDHAQIGELIDGVDFNKATLISGTRFVVLKGKVAKLQRALIQFMLDEAENNDERGLEINIADSPVVLPKSMSGSQKVKGIKEFNIGHFLIGESIFEGLSKTIKKFKRILHK